jgi:hypothetical protein
MLLAAAGQVPHIPADWPGWAILIGLGVLFVAGLRKWFRS